MLYLPLTESLLNSCSDVWDMESVISFLPWKRDICFLLYPMKCSKHYVACYISVTGGIDLLHTNFFNTLPARSLKNIVVIKYNHMKWRKFVTIFLTKKRFILCAGIRTFEIIKMLRISKKLGNCAVKKLPIFASEIILARVGQQKLRTRMIITIHGMLSCNFLPCVFSSQKRKGATIRRT